MGSRPKSQMAGPNEAIHNTLAVITRPSRERVMQSTPTGLLTSKPTCLRLDRQSARARITVVAETGIFGRCVRTNATAAWQDASRLLFLPRRSQRWPASLSPASRWAARRIDWAVHVFSSVSPKLDLWRVAGSSSRRQSRHSNYGRARFLVPV